MRDAIYHRGNDTPLFSSFQVGWMGAYVCPIDAQLHSVGWRTFDKLGLKLRSRSRTYSSENGHSTCSVCWKIERNGDSPLANGVLCRASSGAKNVDERIREVLTGPATLDYFVSRLNRGWKLAAVEWEREAADSTREPAGTIGEEVPYGFKISGDCLHLEQNSGEVQVLLLILEEIVRDRRFSQIADELNLQGLRTRNGSKWTSAAVFDLLPRLIEAGPRLLKSKDWREKRPQIVSRTGASAD
jgi:hypothetical protein